MTERSLPWWASQAQQHADPSGAGGCLDDVDPIEAFRSARRPRPAPPRTAAGAPSDDPAPPEDDDPATDPAQGGGEPAVHRPELCGVCPLCTLARSLEDTHPDLMGHLADAARHLAAAARSLLESAPPAADRGGNGDDRHGPARAASRGEGVQRIPLDRSSDVRSDERTGSGPGGGR